MGQSESGRYLREETVGPDDNNDNIVKVYFSDKRYFLSISRT